MALARWRRVRNSHWTERARLLFPVRVAAVGNLWLIPANLVFAQLLLFPDELPHWLLLGLAGWLGALAGAWGFDREVFPEIALKDWLHEALAGSLLRLSGWFLLLGAVALMPVEVGWPMAGVTALYVTAQFVLAWRFVPLLRMMKLIVPAPPRLHDLVAKVSARMNVRVSRTWMIRGAAANAFALPFGRELLFNERLLDLLSDEELEAVCAHELGHLTESRTSLGIRIIGSLPLLPWIYLTPLIHSFGLLGIIIPSIAMLGLLRGFHAISRRLELRADTVAHSQENHSGIYALALEKIHEANQIPAVLPERKTTHPHLYDRLIAAGVTPSYPRPAPAKAMAWHGHAFSSLVGILLVLYAIHHHKLLE